MNKCFSKVRQAVKETPLLLIMLRPPVLLLRRLRRRAGILAQKRYRHSDQLQAVSRGMSIPMESCRHVLRNCTRAHIAFLVTEYEEIKHTGDKYSAISLGRRLQEQYSDILISHYALNPRSQWRHVHSSVDTVVIMDPGTPLEIVKNYPKKKRVAWIRGNYSSWSSSGLLAHCSHIAVSSGILLDKLRRDGYGDSPVEVVTLGVPCDILQRVADATPQPSSPRMIDVSFIGNLYHIQRPVVDNLETGDIKFAFYGNLPERAHPWACFWQGFADHARLVEIYQNCKIVLEDIAPFNAGTVNLRTFEAAACGALVIANEDSALHELLGDSIVTYQNREELNRLIHYYLGDPVQRAKKAGELQKLVLNRYTFREEATKFYRLLYNT